MLIKEYIAEYKVTRVKVINALYLLFPEYNKLNGINSHVTKKLKEIYGVAIDYVHGESRSIIGIIITENSIPLQFFSRTPDGEYKTGTSNYVKANSDLFALEYCLTLKSVKELEYKRKLGNNYVI